MSVIPQFGSREKRPAKVLANKQYYRSLIDYKPQACVLADFDGDILLVNPLFSAMSGYSEEDLAGLHIRHIVLTPKNEANPLHAPALREFEQKCFMLDARGFLQPVLVSFREIEGQKYLAEFVEAEATPEKQVPALNESQPLVRREEKQEEKPKPAVDLLADQSRLMELRTLVSGLEGSARLLEENENRSTDWKTHLSNILRASDRLKKLVDAACGMPEGIKDSTRIEPIDLKSLAEQVVSMHLELSAELGMPVELSIDAQHRGLTDRKALMDAFAWLLAKALRFCRAGKVVVRSNEQKQDQQILLEVDNLGMDLSPALVKRMTEAGKNPDDALLAQVLQADHQLGEVYRNSTRAGIAWKFALLPPARIVATLALPVLMGNDYKEAVHLLETQLKALKLRVLIVEDDRINAMVLEKYLSEVAETVTAFSGNEALNILEFMDSSMPFNIILMDITLPPPWTGMNLRQEMLSRFPELAGTKFIAQTAISEKDFSETLRSQGFAEVLHKPVDRFHLLRTILDNLQNVA